MTPALLADILDILPPSCHCVALGFGDVNDSVIEMFNLTKEKGFVPVTTINGVGLTPALAECLATTCQTVAISCYNSLETPLRAARDLIARKTPEVLLCQIVAVETRQRCHDLIRQVGSDPELAGLGALSFSVLKPSRRGATVRTADGRIRSLPLTHAGPAGGTVAAQPEGKQGQPRTPIDDPEFFAQLTKECSDAGIAVSFDNCAPGQLRHAIQHTLLEKEHWYSQTEADRLLAGLDGCQGCFTTGYINVHADFFPCTFIEGWGAWERGISLEPLLARLPNRRSPPDPAAAPADEDLPPPPPDWHTLGRVARRGGPEARAVGPVALGSSPGAGLPEGGRGDGNHRPALSPLPGLRPPGPHRLVTRTT
eukprot:GAFH01002266.1.p1 GENE.GAFH01002266.1~~GAFH01002266.1.p1  ORF type:complete len:406 (-),score=35.22 GAFH01002266.1:9-1112(-)